MKGRGCSFSRILIKDSGLTKGIDEETSPFLAVLCTRRSNNEINAFKAFLSFQA